MYVDNRDKDPEQKRDMEKAKEEERRRNMKQNDKEPEGKGGVLKEDRESDKRY